MVRAGTMVLAAALLAGCGSYAGVMEGQGTSLRAAQIQAASNAVNRGDYQQAQLLLGPHLYRDDEGELRLKQMFFKGPVDDLAVHTVVALLWETSRDASLEAFASRYLKGTEREVTLCRLAERNAQYSDAFLCWNNLGDIDRAQRVIQQERALNLLKD